MGYKEVEPDPYIPKKFYKFEKLQDWIEGYFHSMEPSQGQYGGSDVTLYDCRGKQNGETFKDPAGSTFRTFTAKGMLEKQIQKGAPGDGNKMFCGHKADRPTDKSPQKLFKVLIDTDVKAPPKPSGTQEEPPPPNEDDVPF